MQKKRQKPVHMFMSKDSVIAFFLSKNFYSANTLHYINNNRQLEDGDLVLVDAGCEFNGYCADITRTWPVNGKFVFCSKFKVFKLKNVSFFLF